MYWEVSLPEPPRIAHERRSSLTEISLVVHPNFRLPYSSPPSSQTLYFEGTFTLCCTLFPTLFPPISSLNFSDFDGGTSSRIDNWLNYSTHSKLIDDRFVHDFFDYLDRDQGFFPRYFNVISFRWTIFVSQHEKNSIDNWLNSRELQHLWQLHWDRNMWVWDEYYCLESMKNALPNTSFHLFHSW